MRENFFFSWKYSKYILTSKVNHPFDAKDSKSSTLHKGNPFGDPNLRVWKSMETVEVEDSSSREISSPRESSLTWCTNFHLTSTFFISFFSNTAPSLVLTRFIVTNSPFFSRTSLHLSSRSEEEK